MKKYLIIILLFDFYYSYCQDDNKSQCKIDSVFKTFFNYLKTDDSVFLSKNSNADSLCLNFEKRKISIDFFENITGIYLERKAGIGNEGICVVESYAILKNWEDWYDINKKNLVWINDGNKVQNLESEHFKWIDYLEFYPNYIRFIWKKGEIPRSTPPEYIKDLIKKMHPNASPLPAKVKLNSSESSQLKQ
jgi:hypothetical protein